MIHISRSMRLWQKVQDFVELIERTTEPSDLVVDVMAGSGTTGIAALKTGRRFLGFEFDKAVFEIAKTRFVDEGIHKPNEHTISQVELYA